MMAMMAGMMPLVQSKIGEIEPAKLRALAMVMSESFANVADDKVTYEQMEAWTKQGT